MDLAPNRLYGPATIATAALLPAAFLVAFFTLGAAIDWPNSLNGPAESYLALVAANADVVRIGYSFYFGACVLHAVLAVLLVIHLGAARRPGIVFLGVFGLVAGIFKMLGIARWLEAMPNLAGSLAVDPGTTAMVYEMLNDYAGVTLGEGIGVGLFTGLYYSMLALATGSSGADDEIVLPVWLRALAGVTALTSLSQFLGLHGFDAGPFVVELNGYLQYFGYWFLAGALVLEHRRALGGGIATPAVAR